MIIQAESQMMKIAEDLGIFVLNEIKENYVIFLEGDLGTGKTTFCKRFYEGNEF